MFLMFRLERREDSSDGDLKESESESDSDDDSDGESENQSDFIEELKSLFNKLDKESHRVSTAGISKSLGITDGWSSKTLFVSFGR